MEDAAARVRAARKQFHEYLRVKSIPFSALTLSVRRQEEHLACKKLDVGLLEVTFDWSFAIAPIVNHHHFRHQ